MYIPVSDSAFEVEVSRYRHCIRFKRVAASTVCLVNQNAKLDFRFWQPFGLSHQASIGTVTAWVEAPHPVTAIVLRPAGPPATITITSSGLWLGIAPP